MLKVSQKKYDYLKKLSDKDNVINALAIDQRGSLKKMIADNSKEAVGDEGIINFKVEISQELTKYASSILLDPEYGLPAAEARDAEAGLIISYEKTGYDASEVGRLPDLLPIWSAKRIKELNADAVKILLYYDVDESDEINDQKKAFVERVGSECMAEDIPYFLEIVTYDATDDDVKSAKYAKVKPHKVNESMRIFSDERYGVDVLKMEVPVNMNYVEGFAEGEVVYSREEALALFKEQSEATHLPFIFLSAGVSAKLFQDTVRFAKEAVQEWLQTEGRKNIEDLNVAVGESAQPWTEKVTVK